MSSGRAMTLEVASVRPPAEDGRPRVLTVDSRTARLTAAVENMYVLVWRNLRRLGVPASDVDDTVQEVFLVFSKRLDTIEVGMEARFLLATCTFIAKRFRRSQARRLEVGDEPLADHVDVGEDPEQRAAQNEAREQLMQLLDELPYDFRCVFVLFEMEHLSLAEIANALELPEGTVGSRLYRARRLVERAVRRRSPR